MKNQKLPTVALPVTYQLDMARFDGDRYYHPECWRDAARGTRHGPISLAPLAREGQLFRLAVCGRCEQPIALADHRHGADASGAILSQQPE